MKFSSAVVLSIFSAAALAESITTVITATKEGHVYTKTVVQDATFVWAGEGSAATSSAAESSAAESSASTSAVETTSETSAAPTSTVESSAAPTSASADASSADEGSGSSITTVITATKDGHVYTKTVVQDATFVWTGEGDSTWSYSASSAASSEAPVSSAASSSEVTPTTVSSSTSEASTTSEIASYTGAAGALTVGGGFMGVAVAAALML